MNWREKLLSLVLGAMLIGGVGSLGGCKAINRMLDEPVVVTDPETGEVTESTVGDEMADTTEATGEAVGGVLGSLVGAFTANPVLGTAAGSLVAGLFGSAAVVMRRKKKKPAPEVGQDVPPSGVTFPMPQAPGPLNDGGLF